MDNKYPFVNTPLRYPYNALEPYIDEKTMIETADGYAKEAVENLLSSFKDISEPYTFEVKFK